MNITAAQVKELRDATNVSMMDCKRALQEAEGDMDKAVKLLRERGMAVAAKKASRVAKDGKISAKISNDGKTGVMIEINCETDFVTRNEKFQSFVAEMTDKAMDVDNPAEAFKDEITAAIAEIGENIVLRKSEKFVAEQGAVSSYIHMGGKVGVMVEFGLENEATATNDTFKELGLDICLHVAAVNPMALDRDGIPAETVEEEKALFAKQVEGKPENIVEGILKGKLNKFYATNCLLEQGFVKEDKTSITDLLAAKGKELGDTITIKRYIRWQLGEA
ncbi:translation elongation factor Ts [Tichowtungia aerotolerans]|uniref:Elongation factor Ts n=1 Tax=Tichowtungia aerotolerans TaxID=2697043 RepID=A0A6P1M887_9BACT|nr:translation elongation factor Ts [Tichowtungia aerotolerans]QHI70810.1 translation elongation factor Ts [Tichowtungia aerotolerans]